MIEKRYNAKVEFLDFDVSRIKKEGIFSEANMLHIQIKDKVLKESDQVNVMLETRLFDDSDNYLEISIIGHFLIDEGYDEILKPNLLAIMFPYLRSAISFITSIDGKNPIIIPPINFVEYCAKNGENGIK
ncbi:MAG: hypothetical protein RSD40_03695 [Bacilli bacterium]